MGSRSSRDNPIWLWVAALPLLALVYLPIAGLVGRTTPAELWDALHAPALSQALTLSALTTFVTLVVTIVCGSALAVLVVRTAPRSALIERSIELPTLLPPAIAGIALLSLFGRVGWLGQLLAPAGITIPFSTTAVVIAQLFVAAPYYTRACIVALRAIDPHVADAAAIDGATPWQYARAVALPLMQHGLRAGIAQTAARSLSEFGATALFAGNMPGRTRTMALAIYVNAEADPAQAVAMSIVLLVVAVILLAVTQRPATH